MIFNFLKILQRISILGIAFIISCHPSLKSPKTDIGIEKDELKIIHASSDRASLRAGENYWENAWEISTDPNPRSWYVMPAENESIKVSFITNLDSLSFDVKFGEIYKFLVILNDEDTINTQIKGIGPKAIFNEEYQSKHANTTVVEIPPVYELINVAFGLTSLSLEENSHVVRRDIPYYDDVIEWFTPYKEHEAIITLDSILRNQFNMYYGLKLDSYAFEYDGDEIVSKEIYDRIAQNYGENLVNAGLLDQLESFSKISNFQEFYENHKELYNSQINHYESKVNIEQMQIWLNKNFPKTSYDCFKVIFSPLVDWNQSSTWFENNDFKEAQSHVNFPYPSEFDKTRNDLENELKDGEILFTELNHPFINPESEIYLDSPEFKEAFSDISFWVSEDSPASNGYGNAYSLFNELMNWSLVSLYHIEKAPKQSADKLIKSTEDWQASKRGFKRFKDFNTNLIDLYLNREKNQTVADLYPQIISWCHQYYLTNRNKK